MNQFTIGLSAAAAMLAAALWTTALAQTDPNAPTGPFNPNPPAQLTGQQTPAPCGPTAQLGVNGAVAAPPASVGQAQGMQGGALAGAAKDKLASGAGCAGQDHPTGGLGSPPAMAPHP